MPQDSAGQFTAPASQPLAPGLQQGVFYNVFDGFAGLNTKATRPAIEDQEMAWCSNFMPLGKNNLRTLYDKGTALYTTPGGTTISFFGFGNISANPISMVFQSDGSILQVNTATSAATSVAPASTIIDPTQQMGIAQWGSQFILMCAPQANGYFIWDGSLFYQSGTLGPFVTISSGGGDYTSPPIITAKGGAGSGTNFSSTITSSGSVSTITVLSAGAGYGANDVVTLDFSGGGSKTTAFATTTLSGGVVQAITVLSANQGSGYNPSSVKFTIQGGGGFGAMAALGTLSGSGIATVVVTASGVGYTSNPTVVITDANNPVAQATVAIMPFGVQGTSVETFASRAWVTNGAAPSTPPVKSLTVFSAPGSPTDFNVGDGAGAFISTDSFLRVGYHALRQSNGFLYLIGDSSVNYISGVQTSGSPPITTFSNQNVDPQIGSPWGNTVQVYSRAIVFGNTFGIHAMYGGAVQKVSGPLDGVYTTVTPTGTSPAYGSLIPSSAVAVVFGIHIYMQLLPIIDVISQSQTNTLLCWDGSKWFTAVPSVTLTKIASQEINSVLTAWGTDGTNLYPLFNTASNNITKIVQSKLWDKPTYMMKKQAKMIYGLFRSNVNQPASFTVSVDTETNSSVVTSMNVFGAVWTATGGGVATWISNSSAVVTWQATGLAFFGPSAVDATGVLLGFTFTTTSQDYTLLSLTQANQQYQLQN